MLSITTTVLSARLNKWLNLNLEKINICSGDYLFGKLQEKGLVDSLPAIAIERSNLQVDRENRHRVYSGVHGLTLSKDGTKVDKLKVLPILITYSISVIVRGREERDKIETNLLWFLEDGQAKTLDTPITVAGNEGVLPIEISPQSSQGVTLSLNRKESWEEYKSYRIDFDLEVKSFLVKYESHPIIANIIWRIIDNEIILAEGVSDAK